MKARYLFLAAGLIFVAVGVVEWIHAHNVTAAAVNGVTGAIFLYLGATAPKRDGATVPKK